MKHLQTGLRKLILIGSLALSTSLSAQTYQWVDSVHTNAPTGNSNVNLGLTSRGYTGNRYKPKLSFTVHKISIRGEKITAGTPTMDFYARIYGNSANNPTTQTGNSSDATNASTAGEAGTPAWMDFIFDPADGIDLTLNDTVWVVIYTANTAATPNYIYWQYTAGSAGKALWDADGSGLWTDSGAQSMQTRLYRILAPVLTSITPSSGTNGGSVNITDLAGTYFYTGASVSLTKSGESAINATSETVVGTTSYTCTVDLTGAAIGTWNVILTSAEGQADTLLNAFTVSSALVAPSGLSPANSATGISYIPTLSWTDQTAADSFFVLLSKSSDLTSALIDTHIIANSYSDTLDYGTQYYWAIAAKSTTDTLWSDTISFTTANLSAPSAVYPRNGYQYTDSIPTLDWTTVTEADSYFVVLSENSDLSSALLDTHIVATNYAMTDTLTMDSTYYWILASKNELDTTYTDTLSFKVGIAPESTGDNNIYQRFTRWLRWKSY